jgi:hypothetical protein
MPTLSGQGLTFTEVSQSVGLDAVLDNVIDHPAGPMNGGGSAADLNGDGYVDIFLPSGGIHPDRIYYGKADHSFRLSVPTIHDGTDLYRGVGSAIGDYDKDGLLDIYVTSHGDIGAAPAPGGNRLYRNNGDETFTEVATAAGVAFDSPTMADGFGCCFGDYDLDGDLDLYVTAWMEDSGGNRLYRNEGDGTFTDVTVAAGVDNLSIRGFAPSFTDLDGDRYPELLVASDFESTRTFGNLRNGTFRDLTAALQPDIVSYGMGQSVGDFNGDGLLDWFTTSTYFDLDPGFANGNRLYLSQGPGLPLSAAPFANGVNDGGWAWGNIAEDLDHDGDLDIAEVNGFIFPEWLVESSYLFLNDGSANFTEASAATGFQDMGQGRGLVGFDYENDGDIDLLVCNNVGPVHLYRNELNSPEHWLRVKLDTSAHPSLAPDGFGTTVRTFAPGQEQQRYLPAGNSYLGCSPLSAHFGLDDIATLDTVEVLWADGFRTILEDVAADQVLLVSAVEPLTQDPIVQRGVPFSSTVSGILPGETAFFLGSFAGTTPLGPALPHLGGLHLNLSVPILVLGTADADSTGTAAIQKTFAPWFPPFTLATQVVVARGAGGVDSIKSNVLVRQIQP